MQDDTQYLDQLYQNAPGRAPDTDGLGHYQSLLAGGESRADVAVDIALSVEHRADDDPTFGAGIYVLSAPGSELARLYQGILGRAPDSGGLSRYLGQLESGIGRDAVAVDMSLSPEAKLHLAPQLMRLASA